MTEKAQHDPVNHPTHYTQVVPGIECIEVVEHFPFLRGNAIKYLWRAGSKGDLIEDLEKAKWYIQREIDNANEAKWHMLNARPLDDLTAELSRTRKET